MTIADKISTRLQRIKADLPECNDMQAEGRLTRVIGLTLQGEGIALPLGQSCWIQNPNGFRVEAEVIGFEEDKIFLMSTVDTNRLIPGATIIPSKQSSRVAVGDALLGRVMDGSGIFLDGKTAPVCEQYLDLDGVAINPLQRDPIKVPLDVGIRSINALLTLGRGQRMGLFAGSGVGKSVLLGMMTKFTSADVVVVGLVGERGREVKEFIDDNLGEEGLSRSVVIAAPSGSTPLMRLYGAKRATTIAEYFRDQGKNVLLIVDSLTRYAHAAREIGLACGELPATKGYPPSVFNQLSKLVERAGNGPKNSGSITAFYTVLAEGDDHNDPITDAVRSFLDGHVVLSRELADSGHYPAIDIEASISRVLQSVTDDKHHALVKQFKHYYSHFQQHRDMIRVGAYQAGSDPELDFAIGHIQLMNAFLQQNTTDAFDFQTSLMNLQQCFHAAAPPQQHQAVTYEPQQTN